MKIEVSQRTHIEPKKYGIVIVGSIGVSCEKIPVEIQRVYYDANELREAADVLLQVANALDPAKVDNDGWIEWHGGACPVPFDTTIYYRLRVDSVNTPHRSKSQNVRWLHSSDREMSKNDIIKYRVVVE